MKRLLTILFLLIIFYQLVKEQQLNIFLSKTANYIVSLTSKIDSTGDPVKNGAQVNQEPKFTGNALEKTVSRIFFNVLNTREGQRFLQNSLNLPDRSIINARDEIIEISNKNFLRDLFQIRTMPASGMGFSSSASSGQAVCGHEVKIDYKIRGNNQANIKSGISDIVLGRDNIVPGLDAVIVGMKTGEMRQANIPLHYFDGSKTPKILYVNVKLLEIKSTIFVDEPPRIFDDAMAYSIPLLCGTSKKASFHLRITDLTHAGKILYDSSQTGHKILLQLGDPSYPVILSYALHNKTLVGTRVVITKGKYLASFDKWRNMIIPDDKNTKWRNDDYYMIEFSGFEQNADSVIKDVQN